MTVLDEVRRDTNISNLVRRLLDELPWLRSLPAEEFSLFLRELALVETTEENIDPLVQFLREWKSTARAYSDPADLADLMESADDEESIPFRRGA